MKGRLVGILGLLGFIVALPLAMKRESETAPPASADDRLVILSPHNESIRKEFGEAFAAWWRGKTGRSVYVDWRTPGGTSEIRMVIDAGFKAAEETGREGIGVDLFFGGGEPDFAGQAKQGRLAPLDVFSNHPELFGGDGLIPELYTGERYFAEDKVWVGTCLSQFGICHNPDFIARLGIAAPKEWRDLGEPPYAGSLALADPTKSGSVARTFELLVQGEMRKMIAAGGTADAGWDEGLRLIQRMGANARYFTDSASKIPHDVGQGNAAAGMCIDFYGRSYAAELSTKDGKPRVVWTAPKGGTTMSADPIAILKGAPNMAIAQEFVKFCLTEDAQKLWFLKAGEEGGPKERALHRSPIRRDAYVPENLARSTMPGINPYEDEGNFTYDRALTGKVFNTLRVLVKVMCIDSHEEMKAAWEAIIAAGMPEEALAVFHDVSMVSYAIAGQGDAGLDSKDSMVQGKRMRELGERFRENYRKAREIAERERGEAMMNRKTAWAISIGVAALFAVFFIYPAGMVVKQAFEAKGANGGTVWTLDFIGSVFSNPIYREGLWNALMMGVVSTLLTLLIAFPLALVAHRYDFVGKKFLGILVLAPMILPPFVGAVGIKQLLGVNGAFNALLIDLGMMSAAQPFDWLAEGRFLGIVVMNALHLYPILYMNIAAALANLDPAMEQAAENLGCPPWKRFFRITLPLAMPGVFAGSSLVFIWSFTELGVPLVFDYARIAPVQIFDGLKGLEKNPVPYALTAILLVIAASVFALAKLVMGRAPLGTAPRPKGRSDGKRIGGWKGMLCAAFFLGVFLIASVPHAGVVFLSLAERWYGTVIPDELTMRHYIEALGNGLVVPSIQNSLMYAGTATLLAVVIGLCVAWVVVRSDLKIRGWLDALVMMPLAVPGLVMAFGYLALSQEGKPFHFLIGAGGSPFFLLVIAYCIRRLPYVVRAAVAGLQQSNPALEEAAKSLGATPARMMRRVAIPLIAANLAAGAILGFAFAMLEVSDSLILAQQEQHYPITKAIYTLLSTLGNGTELAAALGVWAMVFLSAAIMGAAILGGKRGGLFKV